MPTRGSLSFTLRILIFVVAVWWSSLSYFLLRLHNSLFTQLLHFGTNKKLHWSFHRALPQFDDVDLYRGRYNKVDFFCFYKHHVTTFVVNFSAFHLYVSIWFRIVFIDHKQSYYCSVSLSLCDTEKRHGKLKRTGSEEKQNILQIRETIEWFPWLLLKRACHFYELIWFIVFVRK